jgi:hypothetical protein
MVHVHENTMYTRSNAFTFIKTLMITLQETKINVHCYQKCYTYTQRIKLSTPDMEAGVPGENHRPVASH